MEHKMHFFFLIEYAYKKGNVTM